MASMYTPGTKWGLNERLYLSQIPILEQSTFGELTTLPMVRVWMYSYRQLLRTMWAVEWEQSPYTGKIRNLGRALQHTGR